MLFLFRIILVCVICLRVPFPFLPRFIKPRNLIPQQAEGRLDVGLRATNAIFWVFLACLLTCVDTCLLRVALSPYQERSNAIATYQVTKS